MRISRRDARRLAIAAQCLDGQWEAPKGKEGVLRVMERLGRVQIDALAVVQRAHHHTLWSRLPDYEPRLLAEVHGSDRAAFEYWCRAACYLPMRHYRYYLPRMRAVSQAPRTRQWLSKNADLVRHVKERIRREGPLASADFAAPEGRRRGSWWDWKPAKRALETLFDMGELMIAERRNFQRVYDLAERVLPAGINREEPSREELARFALRRVLEASGVLSAGDMRWGWIRDSEAISEALAEMVDSGEVRPVTVSGVESEPWYAWAETLEQMAGCARRWNQLHILSPFDNLVIDRRRLRALFDFDFSLECYLPAPRRRYGYFCLPILWGDRFIGRLDPKADRRRHTLVVRRLIFESTPVSYGQLLPPLARRLRAFAAFNDCPEVLIEEARPRKALAPLRREIRSASRE